MLTLQRVQISDLQGRLNKPLCCNPFMPHIIKLRLHAQSSHQMGLKWLAYPATFIWTFSSTALSQPMMSCFSVLWPDKHFYIVTEDYVNIFGHENTVKPQERYDFDIKQVSTKQNNLPFQFTNLCKFTDFECCMNALNIVAENHLLCSKTKTSVLNVTFVAI